MQNLANQLNEPLQTSIEQILKFPEVMKNERKETDENEWKQIKNCINDAVLQLNNFRLTEGTSLMNDFEEQLGQVNQEKCLEEIKKLDTERIQNIKSRIKNSIRNHW